MRNYASLADSKYLPQLLALYESLRKHSSEEFALHVLPMDADCAATLARMVLPGMQLVLGFHDQPHMREAKARHNHREYCWLCASNFCEALLEQFELPEVTYLDSDCYFFSDPKVIHDETGDRSIAVIPHRLIPSKKHLESNGQFNVSWVSFKNNAVGRQCCSTWAWQCRERCSESIGCGDQAYLDSWPGKYGPGLAIIQNIGAGLAPWNLANYVVGMKALGRPFVVGHINIKDVVFYHFHEYVHGERLTNYELRPEDIELIYKPYIAAVEAAQSKLRTLQTQTV